MGIDDKYTTRNNRKNKKKIIINKNIIISQ